eukprot:TRINITY_DN21730_c0_g1_i1.p1 TRINITY_DN21730_c0_g1~~TRINITY_DN21730_c0_g1_i1.p1  ORF type:complete len:1393 (+),score=185.94 TRINITY_DN21730_c0_g1_i1:37-4215(+)
MGRWDAQLPYLAPGRGASPLSERAPLRAPSSEEREPSPTFSSSSSSEGGDGALPDVEDIYDMSTAQLATLEEQLAPRMQAGSSLPREKRIYELVRVELSERRGVEEIGLALVGGRLDLGRVHIPAPIPAPPKESPAEESLQGQPSGVAPLGRYWAADSAPPPLDAPSPSSSSRSVPFSARSRSPRTFGAGITSAASTGATPTGSTGSRHNGGLGPGCEPGFKPTRVEFDFVIGGSSVKKKKAVPTKKKQDGAQRDQARPPLPPGGARQATSTNKARQSQQPQPKKLQSQQPQLSRESSRKSGTKAAPPSGCTSTDNRVGRGSLGPRSQSLPSRAGATGKEARDSSKEQKRCAPRQMSPSRADASSVGANNFEKDNIRPVDGSDAVADGASTRPSCGEYTGSQSASVDWQSSGLVDSEISTLIPELGTEASGNKASSDAAECMSPVAIAQFFTQKSLQDGSTSADGAVSHPLSIFCPAERTNGGPTVNASIFSGTDSVNADTHLLQKADGQISVAAVFAAASEDVEAPPKAEEVSRTCPNCSSVVERAKDRFCAECGCRLPEICADPLPSAAEGVVSPERPSSSGDLKLEEVKREKDDDGVHPETSACLDNAAFSDVMPQAEPQPEIAVDNAISIAASGSAEPTPRASTEANDDSCSGEEADDDRGASALDDIGQASPASSSPRDAGDYRSGSAPASPGRSCSPILVSEAQNLQSREQAEKSLAEKHDRPASARGSAGTGVPAAKAESIKNGAARKGSGRGYQPGVPESLKAELKQGGERTHTRRPPLPHDALQPSQREPARTRGHELQLNGLDPALVESGGITSYAEAFPTLVSMFTWGLNQSSDASSKRESYMREALQTFQQFCDVIGSLEHQFKVDLAPTDHATPSATQQALNAMDSRGAGLYGIFLKGIIDKLPGGTHVTPVPKAPSAPRNVFSLRYYKVVQNRTEVYDIVTRVFHRKDGWEELPHGLGLANAWNLLWTWSKPKIDYSRLCTWQKVNHYPENKHLTRKDCLKRSIERYTRTGGRTAHYFHIMPRTFVLPKEYCLFIECFAKIAEGNEELEALNDDADAGVGAKAATDAPAKVKNPNLWIMKPAGSSRGRGISVISDVGSVHYGELTIIQQYLSDPFLIDGYKWDMRTYVTVTSFNPLEAFIYKEGFARFATVPYSNDPADVDNKLVHLTNSSIQRHNEDSMMQGSATDDPRARERQRDALLGGTKINYAMLRERLRARGVDWELVWNRMIEVILKSLLMAEDHIPHQVNSFELFGYDLFLDNKLRVWLIEVNSSPSMGQEHLLDEQVKQPLISDTIDLVEPMVFHRQKLTDVLHRRVEKKAGAGASTRKQLDVDLHAILEGRLPRKFGELPERMGNYERIAPSDACEVIAKTRGNLFSR